MKSGSKIQVAGTNDCSIHSKYSIVTKGYVEDEYLCKFVAKCASRSPIINRGYYVRHRAIEFAFERAFNLKQTNVVISLGAGFDTSALRYKNAFFIELDYPSVCQRKASLLLENDLFDKHETLLNQSTDIQLIFQAPRYLLGGIDMRNSTQLAKFFNSNSKLIYKLINAFRMVDKPDINFILFNECSLCYIEQKYADQLIRCVIDSMNNIFDKDHCVTYKYVGYEMLNSKTISNDFGDFLLEHFDTLSAPILTFINEDDINSRFRNLGFNQVEIFNMKSFWRDVLNVDSNERERVNNLEPFDEFEELDNVCASYCLTIAENVSCTKIERNSAKYLFNQNLTNNHYFNLNPFHIHSKVVSVFGHCSHYDFAQKKINIFGGFGIEPDSPICHRRYSSIVQIELGQLCSIETVKLIKSKENKLSINRMHSRVISIDESKYFLSGGRTSPSKIQSNCIIEIDQNSDIFQIENSSQFNSMIDGEPFPNAYRHLFAKFGQTELIQLGGIMKYDIPNGTIFVFDLTSSSWRRKQVLNLNTNRHSMGYTCFQNNCILMNGGLDLNGNFSSELDSFDLIDKREYKLNRLSLKNQDEQYWQSFYSHHLIPISDYEVISIGGVGSNTIDNMAQIIDLRSLNITKTFRLVSPESERFLAHNLSCEMIDPQTNRICLIGGGGNCFSFGTHFNSIYLYDLK